jgi:hypothetical protein
MAKPTLRPVTELACDDDEYDVELATRPVAPAEPKWSTRAELVLRCNATTRFRAEAQTLFNGTPYIEVTVHDDNGDYLASLTLSNAALANLLTAVAGTKPDVKIRAQHVAGA